MKLKLKPELDYKLREWASNGIKITEENIDYVIFYGGVKFNKKNVVIPEGVKIIYKEAFKGLKKIRRY